MSDNLRRYRAIHAAILQLFPTPPMGNRARHVQTLVALICGIVGSRHTHVSKIADKVPAQGTKKESRIKRFTRWFANDTITPEAYFMPFAATLLQALAHRPVVLVMDGSTVGRGCVALRVSVVYQGRALPLAWTVVPGSTGHFSDLSHCTLLAQVHTLMPPEAPVIFLGDGEFDGVNLQAVLTGYGWEYVCRTARNTVVWVEGEWLSFADLLLGRGTWVAVPHAHVTAQAYGPVLAIAVWEAEHSDPLYLVSNMELAEEACFWYRKRFHIEIV